MGAVSWAVQGPAFSRKGREGRRLSISEVLDWSLGGSEHLGTKVEGMLHACEC